MGPVVRKAADVQKLQAQQMHDFFAEKVAAQTGVDASLEILSEILNSKTKEELFKRNETDPVSGKNFTGVPFQILDWKVIESDIEGDGYPFYLSLLVKTDKDIVPPRLNCGGQQFMATMYQLITKEWIDDDDRFQLKAIDTKSGFQVLVMELL